MSRHPALDCATLDDPLPPVCDWCDGDGRADEITTGPDGLVFTDVACPRCDGSGGAFARGRADPFAEAVLRANAVQAARATPLPGAVNGFTAVSASEDSADDPPIPSQAVSGQTRAMSGGDPGWVSDTTREPYMGPDARDVLRRDWPSGHWARVWDTGDEDPAVALARYGWATGRRAQHHVASYAPTLEQAQAHASHWAVVRGAR